MATIDRTTSPVIVQPTDPVNPTWCPTCLSGMGPIDPWYEEAIDAPIDRAVG